MPHLITEPAATAALTGEINGSAAITSYKTGIVNEKQFGGASFSQVSSIGICLDGEVVTIRFPGAIDGLTPQQVQNAIRTLNFVRVKFTGLTIEVKGGDYNRVTYTGTAEKAELVTAPPTTGK